ncbi:PBSX family phage terminase large subunit [Cohnella lubricantis]|uniref:PBSX family phage terminase large subunit n=1 Tax=Cohnella lubricantis TaxID=2163172 RepID=A0A841TAS7_9BACL|nr:PBSX family phage terminase large subunit [Cohnella lubricantis]MBB6676498.1 PBSX family phage terminase large subunit [Cohnella lubricantis]MBP2117118.1 PBSX family phage terminase large subunit [Cohnella lubricantis]
MAAPKLKQPTFRWSPFSKKQLQVLTWWMPQSPHKDKDAIIADGSVRAGKTVAMSFSYVAWAMDSFIGEQFGMAGKTIGALRRNVVGPLKRMLRSRGYDVHDDQTANMLTVTRGLVVNYFFLFGGKDERSQDLIQGITLAGMFFDEVALMPQSFVNQATARCSVDGAKFWFNCNPAGPYHWFKIEWLDQLRQKNALHLHFTMDDNLSLSEKVKERYRRMYSGIFFKRYILGLWVMAEGVIYDMFDREKHVVPTIERAYSNYYVSCDYGTQNPMTFGLWGLFDETWYKVKEYHYDGRKRLRQKTDEEYCADLEEFVGDVDPQAIIVDPSAASFIAAIRKRGRFYVTEAKNDVLDGIRNTATAISEGKIKYNDCCTETFREFSSYIWDEKAAARGEDKPLKQNDHQMDGDRYFVNTVVFAPEMKYSIHRPSGW